MTDEEKAAWLRGTRTMIGITQQDIAAKFGIPTNMVQTWEACKKPDRFPIPENVLDWVRRMEKRHEDDVVRDMEQYYTAHERGEEIELVWYRSQQQYLDAGHDSGYFSVRNGATLACAHILNYDGIPFRWVYPDTTQAPNHIAEWL